MKTGNLSFSVLIDSYRDSKTIRALAGKIREENATPERVYKIMEVCGGHTHVIAKYGLPQLLPDNIQFVHGPGCPVCIMPRERIDHACILAEKKDTILVTLGDMMRVPGSRGSLFESRARGADVRFVYSPLDTLEIARKNPGKEVIFFAIGFETTTPMTAALIDRQIREKIGNIFYHINHVTVPEPMEAVVASPESSIDAFIAPSHVSVITGAGIYLPLAEKYDMPVVVSGFEPVDIMESLWMILRQFREKRGLVEIQYRRGVTMEGNVQARLITERYFEKAPVFRWRGIGDIPGSSLRLREEYARLDAEKRFELPRDPIDDDGICICGDILKGKSKPFECPAFGGACTPRDPLGACMVSEEGSCAAYYRYGNFR